MYLIPGTTTFPRITLSTLVSKSILDKGRNREEIERKYKGENIAILNHFVYINYQYIKTAEKMTEQEFFFLLQIGFNVEERWSGYL